MVLADRILVDVATGKNTIEGTLASLRAASFPFTCRTFAVYVVLTEGCGETRIRLRLVDVDEAGEALFEVQTVISFSSPIQVVEMAFTQQRVVFPEPGEYRLQLFAADQPLVERRLQIGVEHDGE
jgi:hypothetical protein